MADRLKATWHALHRAAVLPKPPSDMQQAAMNETVRVALDRPLKP